MPVLELPLLGDKRRRSIPALDYFEKKSNTLLLISVDK
jgi:hypothetical protein